MTGKVVYDLADVITNNTSLEMLSLDGNNLQSSACVILQALQCTSHLRIFHLNDNNMSGMVTEDLTKVIESNAHLEVLSLSNNNLGSSAVVVFKALKEISCLRVLNLSNNNMSDQVVYELAGVIKKNNGRLEELYLGNNEYCKVVYFKMVLTNKNLKNNFCINNTELP